MTTTRSARALRSQRSDRAEAAPRDVERRNQVERGPGDHSPVERSVHGVAPGVLQGSAGLRRHSTSAVLADPLGGTVVDDAVAGALRRREGGGAALPESVAEPLSSHFQHDLSSVRVHHDAEAARLAESLHSTAFTHGSNIYFAPGSYQPGTSQGQRLIAHELSHVVAQQTGQDRGAGGPLTVGRANDPAEAAADRSADAAMAALRRSTRPAGAAGAGEAGHIDVEATAGTTDPLRRSAAPPVRRAGGFFQSLLGRGKTKKNELPQPKEANTAETGTGTFRDNSTKTSDVDQSLKSSVGGFTGEKTESTTTSKFGRWSANETTSDVQNGKSRTTSEVSQESLVGGEAWMQTISEHSDAQIMAAFKSRARLGAFSSGAAKKTYGRSIIGAEAGAGYDAMAGFDQGFEASAKIDTSGLFAALEAAAAAYAKGGVGIDAEAKVLARLWQLEFVATGSVSLFAGYEVSAKGRAFLNAREGLGAEGEASAFAGFRGSAEAKGTLSLGPAELVAMASAAVQGGAWASAEGKIAISFDGVEVSGSAEAFAGVEATATGTAGFNFRGKSIVSAKGSVTVAAGVGGKVSGEFTLKGGKLSINIGAFAVKGIGGGFTVGGEIDLYALGLAIGDVLWERYANYVREVTPDAAEIPRNPIVDPEQADRVKRKGYDAFIFDFRAYAAEKLAGSGKTGLNRKRIEKILAARRGQLGSALLFDEADRGIEQAAQEAFGPLLRGIGIRGGQLDWWDPVTGTGIAAVRGDHARTSATNALVAALESAAATRRNGGGTSGGSSHVPTDQDINGVLAKYAGPLIATFGPAEQAEADAAIAGLIEQVYDGVLQMVVVRSGRFSSAKIDMSAISRSEQSAADAQRDAARWSALAHLQQACADLAASLQKSSKSVLTEAKLHALITKHAGPLLQSEHRAVADRVITGAVINGLGYSIKDFVWSDGKITSFEATDPQTAKSRRKADEYAVQRDEIYARAKREFAEYLTKKTKAGDNGVKQARVQAIVDRALKRITPAFRPEADAQLTADAQEALGPMVESVSVSGGVVTLVAAPDAAKALKDGHRTERANRGRFQGDDEVNERRYTVRRLVFKPLTTYADNILGQVGQEPTSEGVKELILDALGSRRDVLNKVDAREYVAQLINEAFRGAAVIAVENDKLGRLKVDQARLGELQRSRTNQAATKRAMGVLMGPLRAYAARTSKGRPTLDGIDATIDRVRNKLTDISSDDLDGLLEMAVMEAFTSSRLRGVKFTDGRVTMLRAAR